MKVVDVYRMVGASKKQRVSYSKTWRSMQVNRVWDGCKYVVQFSDVTAVDGAKPEWFWYEKADEAIRMDRAKKILEA